MRRFVIAASATLFLALALHTPEARADGIFFTDPAAYAAALAQRGLTQAPVRFNEPGTPSSGNLLSGRVAGVTPNGPGDIDVIAGIDIAPSAAPDQTITGLNGAPFPYLNLSGNFLTSPQTFQDIVFSSVSGYFTLTPGAGGDVFFTTFGGSFQSITLNVTTTEPFFFGFISNDGSYFSHVSLSTMALVDPNAPRFASISQLSLGASSTPEPLTVVLLGTGLAGVAGVRLRKRRSRSEVDR